MVHIETNNINLELETPEFIIERDDAEEDAEKVINEHDDNEHNDEEQHPQDNGRVRLWLLRLLKAIGILALIVLVMAAYRAWVYYYQIGVPISTTPSENIDKLKQPAKPEAAEVVMTSDSILGVALDFYAIHGLSATIEMEEPDTADTNVFLYCRSADHKADSGYLGSLVVNGEEKETDRTRLGYMAMADGRQVIGVSRSEKVKDYVIDRQGCFFRQFILVSDGVIPSVFHLHGKVERRAIGRIADQLVFVTSRYPETLWAFADALREYGFTDAIYITGGTDYCFYRTCDGIRHDITSPEGYPQTRWKGIIPWLVFRKSWAVSPTESGAGISR